MFILDDGHLKIYISKWYKEQTSQHINHNIQFQLHLILIFCWIVILQTYGSPRVDFNNKNQATGSIELAVSGVASSYARCLWTLFITLAECSAGGLKSVKKNVGMSLHWLCHWSLSYLGWKDQRMQFASNILRDFSIRVHRLGWDII